MPPLSSCSPLHEKRWLLLKDLTPQQQKLLQKVNTQADDKAALLDAHCQTPELKNKQVLDEFEIRGWMEKNKAKPRHPIFKIFQEKVPVLYQQFQYESKLSALTQADFDQAKAQAIAMINAYLTLLKEFDEKETSPLDLPIEYAVQPAALFKKLGKNAGLVFGMIDLAWSTEVAHLLENKHITVKDCSIALIAIKLTIQDLKTPQVAMLKPPRDPLSFPDGQNPVQPASTIQHTFTRHVQGKVLAARLTKQLDKLAQERTKHHNNMPNRSIIVEQVELLLFVGKEFGTKEKEIIKNLFVGIWDYYRNPTQESILSLQRAECALTKAMAKHGYYFNIFADPKDKNKNKSLSLLYGEIVSIQKIAGPNLTHARGGNPPLEIYYVKNFQVSGKQTSLLNSSGNPVVGLTLHYLSDTSVSVVDLDAQQRLYKQLNPSYPGSWLSKQWKELTRGWMPEEIMQLTSQSVAFHELTHAWRKNSGRDLLSLQSTASIEEASAIYSSIAFSQDPIVDLLSCLMLFSNYAGLDPVSKKSIISFDISDTYHRAFMEFLMDLATQYEVDIPEGRDRLNVQWVEKLFHKIRNASSSEAANNAILQTQVAHAYSKRFMMALQPFQHTTPQENTIFKDGK